jgi:hypothetical protein
MVHRSGPGEEDQRPTGCPPDGPVDPGRSVVDAVECNTARFVDLSEASGGVTPVHLVVSETEGQTASLTRTDVLGLPELQNGLAYFGPGVDSVRVRTGSHRRQNVREHASALAEQTSLEGFEFGGREFALDVQLG